jgi:ankyrin repeat protein
MHEYNNYIKVYLKQANMLKSQVRSGFLASVHSGADLSECLRVCAWKYPGEEETVWNACSFLQHLHGRDEVVPEGTGMVRIYHVLVSANSRAETVEELEGRRKRVVVQVLDTLHADVCRALDAAAETAEFKARLAQDISAMSCGNDHFKDKFFASIKDESAARLAVWKLLPASAYAEIETLGEAVSNGLAIPLLANAKLRLWLEDKTLDLSTLGSNESWNPDYLGLNAAHGRRLSRRRRLLQDSSALGRRGSIDRVCRIVVEDGLGRMGGTTTAALALEDCRERRLVTSACAAALEQRDLWTGQTPLITQVQLGETDNVLRLLQAGANANAASSGVGEADHARHDVKFFAGRDLRADSRIKPSERALLIAAKEGRSDLLELLARFQADLDVSDAEGQTALHLMSGAGFYCFDDDERKLVNAAAVQVLLKFGADIEAKDQGGRTSLYWSSLNGEAAVVQTLVEHGADVAAEDDSGQTPLDVAGSDEVEAVFARHSLLLAARFGNTDFVAEHIAKGADLAARDSCGRTALLVACVYGHEKAVALLAAPTKAAGALGAVSNNGMSSLLAASKKGFTGIVQELLEHGADPAARDSCGRTALMLACGHGYESAATLLVAPTHAAGAIDAVSNDGFSALLWAEEERGLDGVAQRLRECGAAAVQEPARALFREKKYEEEAAKKKEEGGCGQQ